MSATSNAFGNLRKKMSAFGKIAADNSADFIKNRLQNNYGQSVVEGVPLKPHSSATTIIHGSHDVLNLTGKEREKISIKEKDKVMMFERKIEVNSFILQLNETGFSIRVTPRMQKFLAWKGITKKVGSTIKIPSRPVVSLTGKSFRMKKDILSLVKRLLS